MKLLDSASLLAGAATLKVQPGQYAALMIRVEGTTAAADASATDVGLVTVTWRSRPFTSLRFTDLQTVNKMELGYVELDNTTPFNYAAVLLASRCGDGNVFDVTAEDNFRVNVDLSGAGGGVGAAWTGGNIYLYGIPAEGQQMYLPVLLSHTDSISSGATKPIKLDYENMTNLYVLSLTNLASLHVSVDGQEVVDSSVASLQAFSNMDARIEAAFSEGFRINLHRSGALSEALSENVQVKASASGGAAAPIFVAAALDYTPDVQERSRVFVMTRARAKFNKKQGEHKGRPLRVAKNLGISV